MSVSADNTLTFALTTAAANNVTFADKINIYGETLYDYELSIGHERISSEDLADLGEQIKSYYKDFVNFDANDYNEGTRWFIDRVTVSESAATIGVRNAGWAAYDAIMQMDRRDRRLRETAFMTAFALLMHSLYSLTGTLSATIPAPLLTNTLPFFLNARRIAMQVSRFPRKSM